MRSSITAHVMTLGHIQVMETTKGNHLQQGPFYPFKKAPQTNQIGTFSQIILFLSFSFVIHFFCHPLTKCIVGVKNMEYEDGLKFLNLPS